MKNSVSILITNFNKGKFLEKSINSCINQNYKYKEIIVFDDCSTDNSKEILNRKKRKIITVFNKKKKFKSGPLNQISGIYQIFKKSRGNLIFLLDGDDFFKKNKLRIISKKFIENKNLKFIQDRPFDLNLKKNMILKKKNFNSSIWPSFYPTSSIAIKREFLNNFFKVSEIKKFPNLEIDARLSIYAFLNNQFNVFEKTFTIYNFDNFGITSAYKKYSLKWWKKRNEAFDFMKILMKKKKFIFIPSLDYYITKIINFFIYKNII